MNTLDLSRRGFFGAAAAAVVAAVAPRRAYSFLVGNPLAARRLLISDVASPDDKVPGTYGEIILAGARMPFGGVVTGFLPNGRALIEFPVRLAHPFGISVREVRK